MHKNFLPGASSDNDLLFNNGWLFTKQPLNTTLEEINNRTDQFKPVGIPHDWLIYNAKSLYEDSTGWYRKEFEWVKRPDELVFICFDGVYMDSSVYVNNHMVGEWKYGYTAFNFDITEYLVDGKNEIKVSVNFQAPNSRWYSGAGIYRSVQIRRVKETYIPKDGLYVSAYKVGDSKWSIDIEAEIICKRACKLRFRIGDPEGNELGQEIVDVNHSCKMQKIQVVKTIDNPLLWNIESPYLYNIEVDLILDGIVQTERCRVGLRMVAFDPDRGFFLNNRNFKLNGVCEHHDFGCLGAAYNQTAMRRKIKILKKMGVNAIRISHNMPAKELMDLADESGMLIVSEAFDMWKRGKTPYDYARFFPEWHERDIASWVRRDRNHPSLILWSIGNEIYDTHVDEDAVETTKELVRLVREHDPKGNAKITMCSNYLPWEKAQKCAEFVDVVGYNYSEKYYTEHHQKHPNWIIYGSETCSTVQSRGIYHFPYEKSMLADDDLQCSALGNSTTSWGARSTESCIAIDRDLEFSCGQFLWSGFDYIGEPTPYHTKNSYLGQIDTAGFPKDSYYIFQSQWTDFKSAPMVHIFPYWDFNEGQLIDVRICSNAPLVELFLNGESQGRHSVGKSTQNMVGHWKLPYTKGWIEAVAYDDSGSIIAREVRRSFGEASNIQLKPDKTQILTDGSDLIFVEISMTDSDGYPVENAVNRVLVEVSGVGRLVGLDNGDSADYEDYKSTSRKLFSGKLLAVIAAGSDCGEIVMTVKSEGLPEAMVSFTAIACKQIEGVSFDCYSIDKAATVNEHITEIPVRKIELRNEGKFLLNNEIPTNKVTARILPLEASDRKLSFSIVDDAGIKSNIAKLEVDGSSAILTALYNGSFKLRCTSNSGTSHVRVISELNYSISGMGKAYLNPYEFISGGVYTYSKGTPVNGNEKGVATARGEETQLGFENIDFGDYGSDEITVPIFALTDDPYQIQIWEGMPDQGGQLVADVTYQKPSIWNTYQEETFKLNKRLRSISSICFVLKDKVHIKGFSFIRKNKAFERLYVTESDQIYGDSFVIEEDCVRNIGNNVTLQFDDLDFEEGGASYVTICGKTPLEKNAIVMKVTSGEEKSSQLLEFTYSEQPEEQRFCLEKITGVCSIEFVFLPGSDFDFSWFRFER